MIKRMFLIGGGPGAARPLISDYLAQALRETGRELPAVAYIGAASRDDRPFFRALKSLFLKAGSGAVTQVLLAEKNSDEELAIKQLRSSDLIFISGGEVDEGMAWLARHRMAEPLRQEREAGKVFCGLSAGSIMLGQKWAHWEKEGDDRTASLIDCLGYAPVTYDAHGENEGWHELRLVTAMQREGTLGYGIPYDGMIIVSPDGRMEMTRKPLIVASRGHQAVEVSDD